MDVDGAEALLVDGAAEDFVTWIEVGSRVGRGHKEGAVVSFKTQ